MLHTVCRKGEEVPVSSASFFIGRPPSSPLPFPPTICTYSGTYALHTERRSEAISADFFPLSFMQRGGGGGRPEERHISVSRWFLCLSSSSSHRPFLFLDGQKEWFQRRAETHTLHTYKNDAGAACWPGAIKVYCRQMSLFRPVPRFPSPLHREVKIAPGLSCIPQTRVYCIRFVASKHCEMADNQQPQMGGRMLSYIMKIKCTGYQSLKLILTDRRSVTVRLKRNQEKPFVVN